MTSSHTPFETGEFWADNPEVAEVLDLYTGECMRHDQVIGNDYERVIQLRSQLSVGIHRSEPRYGCALCHVPIYLVSLKEERRFFFRHTLEDGRCSARTRGTLSQDEIDACRYNGVKESRAHIQMKTWLVESLGADPRFTDIKVEKRWTGAGEWRQPDVRALYCGVPTVFEVQLSTTYVNVIAARRDFYLREGGLLLWVFAKFDTGARRLTQDDVFYNNNRNAFVVSQATRDASVQRRELQLECIWAIPNLNGEADLQREVVSFKQLQLDRPSQRAFYFDFDGERQKLLHAAREIALTRLAPLRESFEQWWTADTAERDTKVWSRLRQDCAAEGVSLPRESWRLPRGLLNGLYSAKLGRPVGWKFPKLRDVAHRIATGYPEHLRQFRRALAAYGRGEQLRAEDESGNWQKRVDEYKPLLLADDPKYVADATHDSLVRLLFPELNGE